MSIYTPLVPSSRDIRLIQVSGKTDKNSPTCPFVRCRLSIHSLDAAHPPAYTALSYVWGAEPPPAELTPQNALLINGERLLVRSNLLCALRSFQDRDDEGLLWIDALCINQDDREEKGTQIALMGDIYSLAQRTVIWLGPAYGASDTAMDFVACVRAEDFEQDRFESNTGQLKAVMHLLQRPWWTRVWILQEVFLSQLPIARCGARDVPFERFVTLKELHEASYKKSPLLWRPYMIFQSVRFVSCLSNWTISRSELTRKGGSSPFSWMATTSSKLLSTMPHDKIYGVLGLCTAEDRAAIKVDYDSPLRDVIMDVVLRSLATEGLMFLSFVLPRELRKADLHLPSWVPDLTSLGMTQNLVGCQYKANLSLLDPAWTALGQNSTLPADEATLVWSWGREQELFVLYGCLCDLVTFVDPMPAVAEYEGFDAGVMAENKARRARTTIAKFKEWESLALLWGTTPDAYECVPGGRRETFWRTLCCDSKVQGVGRPLLPDFGDRYDALLGRSPPPRRANVTCDDPLTSEWIREYAVPAVSKCANKSFFLTHQGRMGVAMRGIRAGDVVVVARAGTMPYVLRQRNDWGMTFVGEAYLHGVMDGEAVLDAVHRGLPLLKFYLR